MLGGGNQYWNICKEGNKYLIQNRHSGLFIGYNASKQCLVQTTKDKARYYSIYQYTVPPPPPPRVYQCNPVPNQSICLMSFSEIDAKTFQETSSAYGNGLNVTLGQLKWKVASETDAYSIANALRNNGTPLASGSYWLQNSLTASSYITWVEVDNQGMIQIKQKLKDPLHNDPEKKKVLLFRTLE